MRFGIGLLSALLIAAIVTPAAAESYCPNPAHASPGKIPPDLMAAAAKILQAEPAALRDAGYVRCAGPKLMGCYIGANLDCFKADTRRALPGATAWCRANPGSQTVPMSATGHDTIYEWTCKGSSPVAGKAMVTVDPQGYIAENWKEIH